MRVICNRHGDELGVATSWYDDEVTRWQLRHDHAKILPSSLPCTAPIYNIPPFTAVEGATRYNSIWELEIPWGQAIEKS